MLAAAPAMVGPAATAAVMSSVRALMGGRVGVHVQTRGGDANKTDAGCACARTLARLASWSARLTRFEQTSELASLNADPRREVPVGPTLAAVLDWSRVAEAASDGIVDVALLDERIAAEPGIEWAGGPSSPSVASRAWSLSRSSRGAVVRRPPGLRFDLDGVAKGWLADRALALLDHEQAAVVDADGDLAVRVGSDETWAIGVAAPEPGDQTLAVLELTGGDEPDGRTFGLATSGTSIHRWVRAGRSSHHLIDPRTRRPAVTDVVQATILAGNARRAEVLAKVAVILGSEAGFDAIDRAGVEGAILVTDRRGVLVHPATERWLA